MSDTKELKELIAKEGWQIVRVGKEECVEVYSQIFPLIHPVSIHLKLYRTSQNPEIKYQHLKAAHDYLWPEDILYWNHWSERRFKAHCENWQCISYAGGASTGKSYDAAKLAILFWLSNPKKHAVLVMSTSLESLSSRIYGYCLRLIQKTAIEFPHKIRSGQTSFIEYPGRKDSLHTIKAVAAKKGDDETKISSLIGRHPEEGLMVIMDESTDLPVGLLAALPNLKSVPFFQAMAIGNSNSKFDLHGSLSTPKDGWESINPLAVTKWETTQDHGVCLFFSCYDSPAILETDPVKKAALAKIFVTQEKIIKAEKLYGRNSDSFWRFIIGYWRSELHDETVVSKTFIDEFHVRDRAEWGGYKPLQIVGGLDPAFSQGGDQCILRLAILGQAIDGRMLLDFREERLLFKIKISAKEEKAAELQIADQVIEILNKHNCNLGNVAVDSNGQGRTIGELIRLRANGINPPIKIYSVRQGNKAQKSFDIVIKTNFELWHELRRFIETDQLRGVDTTTIQQLCSRLIKVKNGKQILETKQEYKSRMGAISPELAHSPDEADSVALCLQAAIINFGFCPGLRYAVKVEDSFTLEKQHAYFTAQLVEEKHEVIFKTVSNDSGFSTSLEDVVTQKEGL